MSVTREAIADMRRRHGEAIARLVDEAPPLPQGAVDLLRAADLPVRCAVPERGAA